MENINITLEKLDEPDKSMFKRLLEFYEMMKSVEKSRTREMKQTFLILLAINDLKILANANFNPEPVPPFGDCDCADIAKCERKCEKMVHRLISDMKRKGEWNGEGFLASISNKKD